MRQNYLFTRIWQRPQWQGSRNGAGGNAGAAHTSPAYGRHEWHHPAFDLDERALPLGAHPLAARAEQALENLQAQQPVGG